MEAPRVTARPLPKGDVDTVARPEERLTASLSTASSTTLPKMVTRSKQRPLRVAFFGELGSGNTGNDGSFEVALDWVRRGVPDAEIFAICRGPEQLTARFGIPAKPMLSPSGGVTRSPILRRLKRIGGMTKDPVWMFRLLRGTDWVIVPGAGVLESSWARPWALPYALYGLTLAARVRGTRIALVNVGADRSPNRWTRWLVAQVARRADYLTLRDQLSATSLRSLHVDASPAQVYPDLAFALSAPAEQPPRPRCVGVGLINYCEWRGSPAQRAAKRATYQQAMISFVEWLLEDGYAVRLLTGDFGDDPYIERVIETVRARHSDLSPDRLVGEPARNLGELMKQMSEVEVVVGARYHNIITALRLAKPILALPYAPKADQVLGQFELSDFSHPVDAIDLPRLKEQFGELYRRRAEIERELRIRLTEIATQLEAQSVQLSNELLSSSSPPRSFGPLRRP